DTAQYIAIAAELKFLVPLLPRNARSLKHHASPPLEVVDFIKDAESLDDRDRLKLWHHVWRKIANLITEIPGQNAISSSDVKRLRSQEREFWATHWIVKKANSAEPDNSHPPNLLWVPVEINSPKLSWKDRNTLPAIQAVLEALRKRYHIVLNHTCEVHVHVGRLDGQPFSLPSLKRIAALLWLAEPALRLVKDPRSPNYEHVYTWSSPARQHSRLARELDNTNCAPVPCLRDLLEEDGLDPAVARYLSSSGEVQCSKHKQALRLIWACPSHLKLGRLMSGEGKAYRRLGFNFSAFGEEDERARTNPRTVECRFLEGTMADDVVLAWIRIFGAMVEVALDANGGGDASTERRFARTVLRLVDENEAATPMGEESFGELMQDLGVEERVYRPVQKMIRR
ncbi:uncharacterized protein BCR38DRAFT_304936, partial [Pseudomassariella vexata]